MESIRPIQKIFISNRGEIAERISRCCTRLGIPSVSAHVQSEEQRPYVRRSVQSVLVEPTDFLSPEIMVRAAVRSGCDAVHPGYGFMSESAEFAEAVLAAGLIWIGPSPYAIRAMGDKSKAKQLIASSSSSSSTSTSSSSTSSSSSSNIKKIDDIPLIPGYSGDDQSLATFLQAAERVGYPVLLKAAAGGGGKGMRVVRGGGEMEAAMALARSEALRSFGSATLLLEKYFEEVRHVEVQVLGDLHGNAMHLYERECSVQRRHQKLVEECPSPLVTPPLRAAMAAAALALAQLIGYSGAGTVEFIVEPASLRFYFLEVNTRLQVEHPVTEQVLGGLDLVALQIRIAEGHALPVLFSDVSSFSLNHLNSSLSSSSSLTTTTTTITNDYDPILKRVTPPPLRGHAIEVRLCAEDPSKDFFPCAGRVLAWRPAAGEGLRYDSDVAEGGEVSIHFDSLLCKLIAFGATRAQAVARASLALRDTALLGLATNQGYLRRVLAHPRFQRGEMTTAFIDLHGAELLPRHRFAAQRPDRTVAAVAAAMLQWLLNERRRSLLRHVPSGWRNSPYRLQQRRFQWITSDSSISPSSPLPSSPLPTTDAPLLSASQSDVRYRYAATRSFEFPARFQPVEVEHREQHSEAEAPGATSAHQVLLFESELPSLSFAIDGQRYLAYACADASEQQLFLHIPSLDLLPTVALAPLSLLLSSAGDADSSDGAYVSPMPSRILQIHVQDHAAVSVGDPVLTIESMKMEVRIVAKKAGVVSLFVRPDQLIDAGVEMFNIQ